MRYRVREHQGLFYVQVLKKREVSKGILWWKSKSIQEFWVNSTDDGTPPFRLLRSPISTYPMDPFTTLQAAMDKIKTFLTPDKIHEYVE